jgi:hypothetical protein
MPLSVPPPPELAGVDIPFEMKIQRRNTRAFILADPVQIALIPRTKTRLASGGTGMVDGPARPLQLFRLIPVSHTERPRDATTTAASAGTGKQHRNDFTLLGEFDAMVAEDDYWQDEMGEKWIVDSIVPFNGYEVKAMISAFGKRP